MTKNKHIIADSLADKMQNKGISQNEAARQIGVSAATISNVLNGKWENITGAWTKIAAWVGQNTTEWQTAETANFRLIQDLCNDAKSISQARAISFKPGTGKTHAAKFYANNTPEVFFFNCESGMSKPRLLQSMTKTMGLDASWKMEEMLDSIVGKIQSMDSPLLIFDEFDELSEKALRIFKDIYNRTNNCGFVLLGGLNLRKRISVGAKAVKQSYQEILSRIGGDFISLKENNLGTIRLVCQANGITEESQIEAITIKANGDLRAVKALVEALKTTQKV
jgi:DNA transposition AAA+ family ATPase